MVEWIFTRVRGDPRLGGYALLYEAGHGGNYHG